MLNKLKAVFKKSTPSSPSESTSDARAASPEASEPADGSSDAHLFALRPALIASAAAASEGVISASPLDAVQQRVAVASLDGAVHALAHDGALRRVVAPTGERAAHVLLLSNTPLLAVARGRSLELVDLSSSNEVSFRHAFSADVSALCFTAGEAVLFVGLASGDTHVVVVAPDAPPYLSAVVIAAADTHADCHDEEAASLAARGRAPVLQIVALPKAAAPTLIIAHGGANSVVRYNVASQKVERLYCKRDGVGEAALTAVAVHPNNEDVLCVHDDGQFVMFTEKSNKPVAFFSLRGNDGADVGVGVSRLVWTSPPGDAAHVVALVRFDADFKHSVVTVLRSDERLEAMKVVGELAAPPHVEFVGLSLLAASPFAWEHVAHVLATRSDGRVLALSLADASAWQPDAAPSLFHVDRAPLAATALVDACSTAMFVGDDVATLKRTGLWPAPAGAPQHAPPAALDTSEPALVLLAVQSDLSVAAYELSTRRALFRASLHDELAKHAPADPPTRLFGVADCCAVSRAGRPLLLVSVVTESEESDTRCVFAFASSRLEPSRETTLESDFGAFRCQGVVASGARVRIERCHDAAITLFTHASEIVFSVDSVGLVNQTVFPRVGKAAVVNATLLGAKSLALLLADDSIVRVATCADDDDNTELKAAAADASEARAPLRAFAALVPDCSARFYGQQDVPRFLLCAGRELRLTAPPWLVPDAELDAEEREFLGSDESVVSTSGLIRRVWLVRTKASALFIVVYTAREQLQVFRAADLALCTTLELSAVCNTDQKPLEVHVLPDGRGVVLNPSGVALVSLWAAAPAAAAAPTASLFVPNVALPERKSGLLGGLFGTAKKQRHKAETLLFTPAATTAATAAPAAAASEAHEPKTVGERMQQTKQRLLENQEKMAEVADKSSELADESANFAKLAAQLNKEAKSSFFGF